MAQALPSTTIDVRSIAPLERHPLIFSTLRGLREGQSMELLNDHDPRPLYQQMQAEEPGQLSWEYLHSGPEFWQVRITRRAVPEGSGKDSGCCGGCCGGAG